MNKPQDIFNAAVQCLNDGRNSEAEILFRAVTQAEWGFPQAHYNLGLALHLQGRLAEAAEAYGNAVALAADYALAWSNLGGVLRDSGKPGEALVACRMAITHNPGMPQAHNNLGTVLAALGMQDEAVAAFRSASALSPKALQPLSNLLSTIPFMSSFDGAAVAQEARRIGELLAVPCQNSHANERDPNRRLRIGYLTPSLCSHVLAGNLEPLFRGHRREFVSVHVYAHVPQPDAVTEHLRGLVDAWTFVHTLSDDAVAAQIQADGIDILINPMGHWAGNRLAVFARRPAPVQVSYLCQGQLPGLPPWITLLAMLG